MNNTRILQLLEAYLEQSISVAEQRELQTSLIQSPEARRLFWEYTQQHSMIGELLAEAQGRQFALEEKAVSESPTPRLRLLAPFKKATRLFPTDRRRWAVLAAASLLLAILLIPLFRPEPASHSDLFVQLEEVQGDIYLVTESGQLPTKKGSTIRPGQKLMTGGADSQVVLRYPDNTRLEMSPDTVLRLLTATKEASGKQIFLEQGELLAEVVPQPAGRPLLLSTPEAEARVVGTRFRSMALPGATRIELEEGGLLVTRKRDRRSVEVPSGMFVVAGADDAALNPAPLPARISKPRTLLVSRGEPLIKAAYAADGRLVTATGDGWIGTFQFNPRVVPLHFHDDSARHVCKASVSPDGRLLAAGGTDGRVKVRDAAIGHTRTVLDNYAIEFAPQAIGPDGKLRVSAKHIQFRSTAGGLAFAPDGKRLAVVERAKTGYTIKVYDTDGWKPLFALAAQPQLIVSLAFAPAGDMLAATDEKGVTLWNLTTQRVQHRLKGSSRLRTLAFSPDGRWLAAAGNDGQLRLWNARDGGKLAEFPGLFRRCYAVAFSPDSRMLATAHEGHATLWDVTRRREIATFRGHSLAIFSLAFSPDGLTLATAGWERYIRLWNITDAIRNKLGRKAAAVSLPTRRHRSAKNS